MDGLLSELVYPRQSRFILFSFFYPKCRLRKLYIDCFVIGQPFRRFPEAVDALDSLCAVQKFNYAIEKLAPSRARRRGRRRTASSRSLRGSLNRSDDGKVLLR